MFTFELKFDDDEIKKELSRAAKKHIRETIEENVAYLEDRVKKKFASRVRTTPEYKSLVSPQGTLHLDFGLGDPDLVTNVIDTLVEGVTIKVSRAQNDNLSYIIPLSIVLFDKNSLEAVLDCWGASYKSDDNSNWSGLKIEWLKWLLLSGGEPVVVGYQVEYGDFSGNNHFGEIRSRTGYAIMKKGNEFSVDERFQGTREDNFITRAAASMEDDISQIVQDIMERL